MIKRGKTLFPRRLRGHRICRHCSCSRVNGMERLGSLVPATGSWQSFWQMKWTREEWRHATWSVENDKWTFFEFRSIGLRICLAQIRSVAVNCKLRENILTQFPIWHWVNLACGMNKIRRSRWFCSLSMTSSHPSHRPQKQSRANRIKKKHRPMENFHWCEMWVQAFGRQTNPNK